MIDDFIQHNLADIDDLAELKVSLVALHVLAHKLSPAPSITERELMAHPAIRAGLSFPSITVRPALQRAVARGTLLCASIGSDEPRYFANDEAGRRAADAIHLATAQVDAQSRSAEVLRTLAREIERLEVVEVYAPAPDDLGLIEEWLTRGYSVDEILVAVHETLCAPRSKRSPPRTLEMCASVLTAQPPIAPSEYYDVVVARTVHPPEEIVNLRERLSRQPNGHEYSLVRLAVGLFGRRAVLDGLKRISHGEAVDVDSLIPLLAEQEEAALAIQRGAARAEWRLRELVELYESCFGMPPTSTIADEMHLLWNEVNDMVVWRSAFEHAAREEKRSWPYVRKLLQNPSPEVFIPKPANDTASFAFNEYRRRVGRLDPKVAREINDVAQTITDTSRWVHAIDQAANANALKWSYIKKVLTSSPETKTKDGKRRQTTGRSGRSFGRPQVVYTEAERAAAEERARQLLAKRTDHD
jgi:hypothetical protein